MRHDKLERELNLLLFLIENHSYTVDEICDKNGISRRNLYYYLEFFRDAGFIVEKHGLYFRIRKDSPFFRKLDATVHFTEDEAILMRRILEHTGDNSPQVQQLMHKLDKLYDLNIIDSVEMREQVSRNASALYQAIKGRLTVVLQGYSSPHSNTVQDRVVEPYLFMNGNQEIRCFELSSAMNKTFKLSRIGDVKLLDVTWANESRHRAMNTDIFMFSAEQQQQVSMLMGRLSTNVLREEYPRAERYIRQKDADHWLCQLPVSSYVGVGRFVLGLYDDIEVLEPQTFRDYLKQKINAMAQALSTSAQ